MATDPDQLLREAEDQIEAWCCELDAAWLALHDEADQVLATARTDAAEIVALARVEADLLVADARAEAEEIHRRAGEHEDVIRALEVAERLQAGDHLTGLREAIDRLRSELSNVVDAAFDALPAVEATAAALDEAMEPEVVIDLTATAEEPEYAELPPARELVGAGAPARRSFFRRLLRR
jgi:hypothetical protein